MKGIFAFIEYKCKNCNTNSILYSKGFCLGIAYSASTGGAGSLVGTTPNLLLKGYFDDHYPDGGLNFITYLGYSLPVSIIMITLIWIILALIWLPRKFVFFERFKQLNSPI